MSARAKRSAPRRSPCPVSCALDLLGDRWTLLIIRDLFAGKARFRDLIASPERIASNILAARLKRLRLAGILEARESLERAGSDEYHLTPRGRSLLPVLVALRDWGLLSVPGTEARVRVKTR
ncbi:helix-turn-helix domain-containing protein [soil metagenome]